jgi:hypothetical protein
MCYLETKTIPYYNPTRNVRRANRMQKYKNRPYNTIVEVRTCPEGCSPTDMMDYYKNHPDWKVQPTGWGEAVTLQWALQFVV